MQKCIVEDISEDDCIAKENHVSKRHAIKNKYADVAQLAEQLICNQQVNGSSPFIGFLRKAVRFLSYYGQIPEWPKGADCKSVGTAFEGSNPSLPSIANKQEKKYNRITARGGAVWKLAGLITRRS